MSSYGSVTHLCSCTCLNVLDMTRSFWWECLPRVQSAGQPRRQSLDPREEGRPTLSNVFLVSQSVSQSVGTALSTPAMLSLFLSIPSPPPLSVFCVPCGPPSVVFNCVVPWDHSELKWRWSQWPHLLWTRVPVQSDCGVDEVSKWSIWWSPAAHVVVGLWTLVTLKLCCVGLVVRLRYCQQIVISPVCFVIVNWDKCDVHSLVQL